MLRTATLSESSRIEVNIFDNSEPGERDGGVSDENGPVVPDETITVILILSLE